MCSGGGRLGLPEQKKEDEGVLLCDGSGNEGEGRAVPVGKVVRRGKR